MQWVRAIPWWRAFLAGYLKLGTYSYALRMGAAAGSATAFSDELATKEEILKLLNTF